MLCFLLAFITEVLTSGGSELLDRISDHRPFLRISLSIFEPEPEDDL